MTRRPAVSLGDLVRAARRLDMRDEPAIASAARLLGLAPAQEAADGATPPPSAPPATPSRRETPGAAGTDRSRSQIAPPIRSATAAAREEQAPSIDIEPLPPEPSLGRAPRETPALDSLLAAVTAPPEIADTTLFNARWQRGIVSAAISTDSPGGPLDVSRVVDRIARGSAVQRLPRLMVRTTRKGLQVLLDIGEGMRPFADDSATLEHLLRQTAGRDSVDVLRFDRTPAGGVGPGTRRTWSSYRAPAPGTPVLVLSDFGLSARAGDVAGRMAWEPVAQAAATARCPLLALTPFPPDRWPAWLVDLFEVLQWDRSTNAAGARRVAAAAWRRSR